MIIGELYLIKEFFWLLLPTKELAGAFVPSWRKQAYQDAKWLSELLSERYKCNLPVAEENTYVVLLEQDEECSKVLDSNGNVGWIGCSDFSKYLELVKAKQ